MIRTHLKLSLVISCIAISSSGAQLVDRMQFKDSLVAELVQSGRDIYLTYSLEGPDSTIFVSTPKIELNERCPITTCLDQLSKPGSKLDDVKMRRMGFTITRIVDIHGEVMQRVVGGGHSTSHTTTYAERSSGHHYFQRKLLIFRSQASQDEIQRIMNTGATRVSSAQFITNVQCIAPAGQEYEVLSIGWFNLGYRQVEVLLHGGHEPTTGGYMLHPGHTNEGCRGWTRTDFVDRPY